MRDKKVKLESKCNDLQKLILKIFLWENWFLRPHFKFGGRKYVDGLLVCILLQLNILKQLIAESNFTNLFPWNFTRIDSAAHILNVLYVIVTTPAMNQNLLFSPSSSSSSSRMNILVFADITRKSDILVVIVITNQLCKEEYFQYGEFWNSL